MGRFRATPPAPHTAVEDAASSPAQLRPRRATTPRPHRPEPPLATASRHTGLFRSLLNTLSLALALAGSAEATGFRQLESAGESVGVWYPTETAATRGRLGPFDVEYAFDAAPAPGPWPPLLLSHGNSGLFRNHHLTAAALAEAGFVVIAPQHGADHRIGGGSTAGAMALRIEELRRALEAVRADALLGPTLDLTQIHALGYSLGGATVIAAAGAGIDLGAVETHCDAHGDDDAVFCEPPPLWWRIVQRIRKPVSIEDMPDRFFVEPFVDGSIAVVAPIGQGLEIVSDDFVATRVLVVAIEGDRIAQPHFHAEALAAALPPARLADFVSVPGHHYAFIAPFPEWLTSKEDIPVARDPQGFDRPSFIDQVNRLLGEFFGTTSNP